MMRSLCGLVRSQCGSTFGGVAGEDSFDYEFAADTAKIVARVLTARAVQKLLLQLNETDIYQARWLTDYASANPPMGGDKVCCFDLHTS